MPRCASGLCAPTSALPEVDLPTKNQAAGGAAAVGGEPVPPPQPEPAHPPHLEELDRRLEGAFLRLADAGADELCVWACACFLAHGS